MKKKLNPFSKEVTDAIVARINQMTPEEVYEYITYRTPGIEETDMTGLFPVVKYPKTLKEFQEQVAASESKTD